MDSETLINCIRKCQERGNEYDVPGLCIAYLMHHANDYANDGKTAKRLLEIVGNLINAI